MAVEQVLIFIAVRAPQLPASFRHQAIIQLSKESGRFGFI